METTIMGYIEIIKGVIWGIIELIGRVGVLDAGSPKPEALNP